MEVNVRRRRIVVTLQKFMVMVVVVVASVAVLLISCPLLLPASPPAEAMVLVVEGFTTTTVSSSNHKHSSRRQQPSLLSSPSSLSFWRTTTTPSTTTILQAASSSSSSSSSTTNTNTIETGDEQQQQQSELSSSSSSSSSNFIRSPFKTTMDDDVPALLLAQNGKTLAGNYVIEMELSSSSSLSSSKSSSSEASVEEGIWSLYPLTMENGQDDNDSDDIIIPDGARAALALLMEESKDREAATATTTTADQQPLILQLVCQRTEQDQIEVFQRRRRHLPPSTATAAAGTARDDGKHEQVVEDVDDEEFIRLLQILQVQWMTNIISLSTVSGGVAGKDDDDDTTTTRCWHISFDSSHDVFYDDMSKMDSIQRLFEEGLAFNNNNNSRKEDDDGDIEEWVEMMSNTNQRIAILPRSLIHKYNILHRGVGIFVTKDHPIKLYSSPSSSSSGASSNFPDLYVHRRVSTKRIFPSLYDMFVGGVSVANEPSYITARREVGEELGLHGNELPSESVTSWSIHNHDDESNPMLRPEPILTCLICTSYNRCLVDLFQYTMSTEQEAIVWQEEEVSWGDFVSYQEIADAAEFSIGRFHDANEWPGSHGYFPPRMPSSSSSSATNSNTKDDSNSASSSDDGGDGIDDDSSADSKHDSMNWDFVPDGLLVWRAWLDYLNNLS